MNWHHWYWWTWPAGIAIGVTLVCAFNWTVNEIGCRRTMATAAPPPLTGEFTDHERLNRKMDTATESSPCPVEAVFPDQSLPCLLQRGHEPPHQYTPQPCEQCGCLPGQPWGCGCSNEECPCSEAEDEECE